jgi:hypothetical protein
MIPLGELTTLLSPGVIYGGRLEMLRAEIIIVNFCKYI